MKKELLGTIISGVLILSIAWFVWMWFFCRFYVQPDRMAVVISKTGKPLDSGQILAKKGQKGIWEDVLGEGRHFLNPILYDHEILPIVEIAPGKVGVVTSKIGKDLSEEEFLAEKGEKGISKGVIGPGKYRLNPQGYQIEIIDAISIPIGYSGVVTSLAGKQAPAGEFAGPNEKGIRRDILQPGLYFVNTKQFKVDVLEIGVNQVSLLGKTGGEVLTKGRMASSNIAMEELSQKVIQEQKEKRGDYLRSQVLQKGYSSSSAGRQEQEDQAVQQKVEGYLKDESTGTFGLAEFVEFPSRDGFQISLDMTVEFELEPKQIAGILNQYGDLPAVVDKIIMPQISSISRNKGSEYRAKDFIVGEGREKFQKDLTASLANTLAQKSIVVHNALIRHVEVPVEILEPIQQAGIAIEQDLTNKEKQNTMKKFADLNTELSLIEQRREQVAEETKKIRAEIYADKEKKVAEIQTTALKQVSEIEKETSAVRAEKVRTIGRAEADAIQMVEGEKSLGLQLKTKAFGDPVAYGLWEFANRLDDDLSVRIIHSGEGTLWTDLEKARLGDLGAAEVINK